MTVCWLVLLTAGCSRSAPMDGKSSPSAESSSRKTAKPREVAIAAASDLKFALDDVIAEFQKLHPEFHCQATYGASGNFFAQLSNHAPFDLFLSADIGYPRKLIELGLASRESEFSYAVGHLVLWIPKDSPLNVEQQGIQTLLDPSVRKIAIANPRHAPYGRAAEAALESLGVHDQIESRLVLAENIAQAAQWLESGAAEIGLISRSLALAPAMRDKGRYWSVPADAFPTLEQGGVILNGAQDPEAAAEVRSFLISEPGRTILKKYGFEEPNPLLK
ncbi:MAG: molybdate ABC transporter substrate-binding protein [Planctomycetes bacterium]|nr:molybdate ABC transporter substrate-binding protein [Planctomycetota bacterium]